MRSIFGFTVLLAALWLGIAGVALAAPSHVGDDQQNVGTHNGSGHGPQISVGDRRQGPKVPNPGRRGHHVPTPTVPELDPNAAGLALSLLVGGVLLLDGRRRVRPA